MRGLAACLLLMMASTAALAQPGDALPPVPAVSPLRALSTDRPDKTESPYTVPGGRFQIEVDFATFTRDRANGVRTETFTTAPFNLKYGVTDRTDVQLLIETYTRQTTTDRSTGTRDRIEGFGDVTVRLKHNLWGNDDGRTALALMPFFTLPTAGNGLGSDAVEFGLIVPLAIGVAEGIGVGLMTEVDFARETDGGGYSPSFVNSATIAFDLTDRLGLYTELFTERGTQRGARWIVTGDVGLTYALSENTQLDTGINLGLTEAADDLNLFVGFSRRF